MARAFLCTALGFAIAAAGCGKDDESKPATPVDKPAAANVGAEDGPVDPAALASAVGVEPGGFAVPEGAGAEAVATGTALELRRIGEEVFEAATGEVKLYTGDQLRTGAEGAAEIVLVDRTVIELGEDSAVAIGDRDAAADPASSAAVLAGVARFSVSERGPGEGPFLVFTPGGVIGTKGTTFAVGVSVTGAARVGVEEGEVEVAGLADLETPVAVGAKKSVAVDAAGAVAAPAAFEEDDWGEWRDGAEADLDPVVVVKDHRAELEVVTPQLETTYDAIAELEADLDVAAKESEEYEVANNTAGYRAAAPGWGASVEASFLASLRLQHLTYKALTHAYLANAVYRRHPKKVEKAYRPGRGRIAGAVLWHKRYHGTVHLHVKPRRGFYYRNHPRGRKHAAELKLKTPKFYRPKLLAVPAVRVRARAKVKVYRPPVVVKVNRKKAVVVAAPVVGWRAKARVKRRDHRRKGGWYVRPKTRRSKIFTGVKIVGAGVRVFSKRKRVGKGAVKVRWGVGARAKVKVGPRGGVRVKAKRAGGKVGVGVKGGVGARVQTNEKIKAVRVGPKGGIGVRVKTGDKIKSVRVGPKGGVKVKVKKDGRTHGVKVGPKGGVKIKAKRGAGIKVGPKGGVKIKSKRGAGIKVKAGGGVRVKSKRKRKK